MKIALIGYGRMGKAIEAIARERGHEISQVIDVDNPDGWSHPAMEETDAAIEFTSPEAAHSNILRCFEKSIPVVSGTTGWLQHWDEVIKDCKEKKGTLFYASNFSIGVNILFAINQKLAELMNQFPQYDVQMKEVHHIHKKDAPSGTAISLADQVTERLERITSWSLEEKDAHIHIEAKREGEVTGYHQVTYDSPLDIIRISHEAKSRKGFATGAVMAAEFIKGKEGIFTMQDLLNV